MSLAWHEHDCAVLVIGAGAAGLRAGWSAAAALASPGGPSRAVAPRGGRSDGSAPVLVITRGRAGRAGASFVNAAGALGMQACIAPGRFGDDSPAAHAAEIVAVGRGVADPALAALLADEAPARFADLVALGVPYRRDARGNPVQLPGCFSTVPRAVVFDDLAALARASAAALTAHGGRVLEGLTVATLLSPWGPGRGVAGALAFDERGAGHLFRARATVLAAGGAGGAFAHRLYEPRLVGAGVALGAAAGARTAHLEFLQWMLGVVDPPAPARARPLVVRSSARREGATGRSPLPARAAGDRFFPIAALRGARVRIAGEPFDDEAALAARAGHFPFSMADGSGAFDRAVQGAIDADPRRRPARVELRGADGIERLFHVRPLAHAMNGGLVIDADGRTTVPGLFAGGECAAGPHGADRLGGGMIAAAQVFGRRAGRAAAGEPDRAPSEAALRAAAEAWRAARGDGSTAGGNPGALLACLRRAAQAALGPARDAAGLARLIALADDTGCRARARPAADGRERARLILLEHAAAALALIARAALRRTRTLGSHCRRDEAAAGGTD